MKATRQLAIVVLAALTGCGSGQTSQVSSPPASAPPPTIQPAQSPRQPGPRSKPAANEKPAEPAIPADALLVGGAQPNVLVMNSMPPPESSLFRIEPRPIGADSTLVFVEPPPGEPPPAEFRPLPDGFEALRDFGWNEAGWPRRIRCARDRSELALIEGGPFVQGLDKGPPNAAPSHVIELDSYYIDVWETTVGRFQAYREAMKSEKKTLPGPLVNAGAAPDLPALGVNYRDALQYLKWVGKEIPTEAEWEKAARGDRGWIYPWGDGRPIWEHRREPGQIDPVGSYRLDQSVYGVLDVVGNAREWCQDWYSEEAYQEFQASAGVAVRNWTGPRHADSSSRRVVKGSATGWDVWARDGASMGAAPADVGFRGVLHVAPGSAVATDNPPAADRAAPQVRTPPVRPPVPGAPAASRPATGF